MRLGKRELETVRLALTAYLDDAGLPKGEATYVKKLLDKVLAQKERKVAPLQAAGAVGVNAGPIHDALLAAASPKVPSMAGSGPAWWARASRRFAAVGATPDKAAVLGRWIAEQAWMTGQVGWDTVLHKWEDWYARASQSTDTGTGEAPGRRKATW